MTICNQFLGEGYQGYSIVGLINILAIYIVGLMLHVMCPHRFSYFYCQRLLAVFIPLMIVDIWSVFQVASCKIFHKLIQKDCLRIPSQSRLLKIIQVVKLLRKNQALFKTYFRIYWYRKFSSYFQNDEVLGSIHTVFKGL